MPYYTRTYNPQPTARVTSQELKNEFQAIDNALDAVEADVGKGVRAPEATTALPNAASRALKVLSFDASGNPRTTISEVDLLTTAAADAAVAETTAAAAAAAISEANALSSANAAAMVASPFTSGETVGVGDVRYSPVDMLTYRAKTAGAHTADPSADATNWARISGNLVGADLKTVGGVSLVGAGDVPIDAFAVGDLLTTARALSAPDWLECNGAEYLSASYPDLVGKVNYGMLSYSGVATTTGGGFDSWRGIAYGNGRFVAVATSGKTASTSTDGITWTANTGLPTSTFWSAVAYGNGVFVAVSRISGTIAATSPDGITWTARTLPSSQNWAAVTYGNGVFVAVGSSSAAAATSPDGITWTARTLPSSSSWSGIAFGNGRFVAVAESTTAATASTDGITWTAGVMPSSSNWVSVAYGNGVFVAVSRATGTIAATSTDGITWTARTLPTSSTWRAVAHGNGLFFAVGSSSAAAATSPDGITWTARTLPSSQDWYAAAYGGTRFVAFADAAMGAMYYTAADSTKVQVPVLPTGSDYQRTYIRATA